MVSGAWDAFPEIRVTPAAPPETAEALQSLARSRMGIGVLWRLDEGGRPDLMQVRSSAVSSPLGGEPLGAEFVSLGIAWLTMRAAEHRFERRIGSRI